MPSVNSWELALSLRLHLLLVSVSSSLYKFRMKMRKNKEPSTAYEMYKQRGFWDSPSSGQCISVGHLWVLTCGDLFVSFIKTVTGLCILVHTVTKRYMEDISSSEILVDRHKIMSTHLKIYKWLLGLWLGVCGWGLQSEAFQTTSHTLDPAQWSQPRGDKGVCSVLKPTSQQRTPGHSKGGRDRGGYCLVHRC